MSEEQIIPNSLVWDGHDTRIVSHGFRFILEGRPALSFNALEINYNPEAKQSEIITMENVIRSLNEEELAEIQDYLQYWIEDNDFTVYAYSEPYMLYEGEMMKSTADEKGFKYRVNEVPESPNRKWTGTKWEILQMVIMDNGHPLYYPDTICDHCVFGFTEEEMKDVPEQPSNYHIWDFKTSTWIDPRPLEEAKRDSAISIRCDFEFYRIDASPYGYYIPDYEHESWRYQLQEAKEYLKDDTVSTPFIDAFLEARTDEDKPTKQALCEDIINNNEEFLRTIGRVMGEQWNYLNKLKDCTTNEECIAVMMEAKQYAANKRTEIEELRLHQEN